MNKLKHKKNNNNRWAVLEVFTEGTKMKHRVQPLAAPKINYEID
jgi:hypothetical protein